jgi:hypothetical protein
MALGEEGSPGKRTETGEHVLMIPLQFRVMAASGLGTGVLEIDGHGPSQKARLSQLVREGFELKASHLLGKCCAT